MYEKLLDRFKSQARAWITEDHVTQLRCVRHLRDTNFFIQDASLTLVPPWAREMLNPKNDMHLEVATLIADQKSAVGLDREAQLEVVDSVASGVLALDDLIANLRAVDKPMDYHSEIIVRDRWTFPLTLLVQGDKFPHQALLDTAALEDELRQTTPPFDGISDLSQWLNLSCALDGTRQSSITVVVHPPVELIFEESKFEDRHLTLKMRCTTSAEVDQIRLAARLVPGTVSEGRLQMAEHIVWDAYDADVGYRTGTVTIKAGSAVSIQMLLSYRGYTAARQWFHDGSRSRSARHLSMIQFDPDLKGLRSALFINNDARDFEKAVGCVAYLAGLATALPLQSRTPDLVGATPRGRQLVIECTLAISDFSAKMGKLVDRCNALKKSLASNELTNTDVVGVLVCRQPSDQIARNDIELHRHRIVLVTGEDLERALIGAWHAVDADVIVDRAIAKWSRQNPLG